eukprot:13653552-Ditylum_brightwellii.AAC.1
MAYEHLQDRLQGRKVAKRNPVFGNIASCQKAHFISREEGVPGNLTTEFKNISKEKSTSLSKQKIFIPKNVNDGKHMLTLLQQRVLNSLATI